ncbi:tRNA threonylcarbamoyladenosine biosynthesis protein TsaE [Thermosyntropha lipolytica DSM 11003]|uniref:tRNA threonylcarbamoyladenosine biosynthesis protein TsaE n=1 Tax=Thermosyntropha lipolytica DSM 11003 TaxID=1123382 RepID=A0A1M5JEN7_9FIRM|nr:tRNA (adenosine(37)-N6)-threonylcarbamoyltransferase complex ATPase subunit type 1 TsaE [Thermosyntropha lipolytica]SHG39034.1 tRNA threonylcarbamoyladenosine biosynthesis protein TsaE [Thermosyntropha lipolytica DSM 11003]
MELIITSAEDMEKLGRKLASVLKEGDVAYLIGELGAGKTTLVRGIAKGLGYEGKVTSPTFTLMNIYEGIMPVFHFDFYRLDEDADFEDLGLDDYVGKGGVTLIEWPRLQSGFLPAEALFINIEILDGDYDRGRKVRFTAKGEKYRQKIKELKEIAASGN